MVSRYLIKMSEYNFFFISSTDMLTGCVVCTGGTEKQQETLINKQNLTQRMKFTLYL